MYWLVIVYAFSYRETIIFNLKNLVHLKEIVYFLFRRVGTQAINNTNYIY